MKENLVKLSEIDAPPTLYKYRKWNDKDEDKNHKIIITNQEIYFSPPSSFIDKSDCRNPIRYDLLTDEDVYDNYFFCEKKRFPKLSNTELDKNARLLSKRKPINKSEIYEPFQKIDFESFDEIYGVMSLTVDNSNNKMWDSYADKHNGFAIGFDSLKLFAFFEGGGGEVIYCDELSYQIQRKISSRNRQNTYGTLLENNFC